MPEADPAAPAPPAPVPVAAEPVDEVQRRAEAVARERNAEAWRGLWQFGQPVAVISVVGATCAQLHGTFGDKWTNTVYEPCVTVPLAMLAVASVASFAETNMDKLARNYAFYFCKGLMTSAALLLSIPLAVFFEKLNDQWFRDVFTGNMLHPSMGAGLRTLAVWRTLDLALNARLVQWVYG